MFPKDLKGQLLKHFNIENADPLKQEEFLSSFEDLANEITIDVILEGLSAEDQEIFLNYVKEDGENGEKAINFAKEKIPGLEEKIGQKVKEEIGIILGQNT